MEPSPVASRWANLPNWLTAARFLMAAVLFVFIAMQVWAACLPLFLLAAITDWLDGFLARRYHWTSDLGRNLDPLADKVLVCGAFILLLQPGTTAGSLLIPALQPWVVLVVVMRELAVTALRTFMEGRGAKFGADWLGKLKMWLQCAAVVAIFLVLMMPDGAEVKLWLEPVQNVLIYLMAAATVLSGLQYLVKAYRIVIHSAAP
jgi:CDP-diacylglycerol--glycerol-3-phosphate 3-phosphatidyltransferase